MTTPSLTITVPTVPKTRAQRGTVDARLALALVSALVVVLLLVAGRAFVAGGAASEIPIRSGPPVAGESLMVVRPGDTLWGIAAELAPTLPTGPAAERIAARNGTSQLQVGQRLIIPDLGTGPILALEGGSEQ